MVHPITSSSSTESISHSMPLLEFDKIGLEYPFGDSIRRIIQEISLSINLGEFVSFVGPSGCGKTSILRMVSGLSPTKIGELRCHGQPVIKPLKNLCIYFQNTVL
ncbi:MAG: ATP-binding cassette domain-containing protein, partial [Pseudanabaena sp.]